MTIAVPPKGIPRQPLHNFPAGMAEQAPMFGRVGAPGPYLVLIRRHQGHMSAPPFHETDRLCVAASGTRCMAGGEGVAPGKAVAVPAGSFVRRVAGTPHCSGVIKGAPEPAAIAVTGMGPIHDHLTDASKHGWREV